MTFKSGLKRGYGVIATTDMEEGALQVDYDGRLVEYEFEELGELLASCLILSTSSDEIARRYLQA